MNILAVGDVTGEQGLDILHKKLRHIIKENDIAFTVVNGENADMTGILPSQAEEIFNCGADIITLGNHTWGKHQILNYLDDNRYILRPANFSPQVPGRGYGIFETNFGNICVINLIGRFGMGMQSENPFLQVEKILDHTEADYFLLDFHAEATSEKLAMAWYLDGRISAIWGTHTHVQTSDAIVLPKGTGYITDLGMTGPIYSVLGVAPEQSISMFLGNPPQKFSSAGGHSKLECAVFELDEKTKRCLSVQTMRLY